MHIKNLTLSNFTPLLQNFFFLYLFGMTPVASLIRGTQRQEKFIHEKGVSCIDLVLNSRVMLDYTSHACLGKNYNLSSL